MPAYKGNDPCILFHGDYKPAELYGPVERPAVWWNQLAGGLNQTIGHSSSYFSPDSVKINGIQWLANENGEVTANGTATVVSTFSCFLDSGQVVPGTFMGIVGHLYLVWAGISGGTAEKYYSRLIINQPAAFQSVYGSTSFVNEPVIVRCIGDLSGTGFVLRVAAGNTVEDLKFKPRIVDLTAMFGEGNEPTAPEEVLAMLSAEFGAYNSGEWQTVPVGMNSSFTHAVSEKMVGWTKETQIGKEICFDGTYNDILAVEVRGQTWQKQYQGYNLVETQPDLQNWAKASSGNLAITIADGAITVASKLTSNADTYFRVYTAVPLLPNKTYTLSLDALANTGYELYARGTRWDLCIVYKRKGQTQESCIPFQKGIPVGGKNSWERYNTFVTTPDYDDVEYWQLNIASDGANLYKAEGDGICLIKNVQLEEGTIAHGFEPYVGGKRSPNADFPQDIVPLTEQKTKVLGKTLVNPLAFTRNKALVWSNGGTFNESGSICFEQYLPVEAGDTLVCNKRITQIMAYDSTKTYLGAYRSNTVWIKDAGSDLPAGRTLTIKDGISYLRIALRKGDALDVSGLNFRYYGMSSDFSPYRSPQYLITNYELYGSDGLYDTIEPCVLVDGEWKCRVTRRWGKWVYDGIIPVHCDTNYVYYPESRPYNYVYLSNRPFVIKQYTKHCLSNRGVFANSLSSGFSNGGVVTTTVASVFVPNQAVRDNSKEEYLAAVQEYLRQHPYEVIVERETPIVELYDPIMLYTNPYTTIIRGNTEMVATAKVADLPDKSS